VHLKPHFRAIGWVEFLFPHLVLQQARIIFSLIF